jgi:hypothetical protein
MVLSSLFHEHCYHVFHFFLCLFPSRSLAAAPAAPAPTPFVGKGVKYVDIPNTNIRKVIAQRLSESKVRAPYYLLHGTTPLVGFVAFCFEDVLYRNSFLCGIVASDCFRLIFQLCPGHDFFI